MRRRDDDERYIYVGDGPTATGCGPHIGWSMGADLYARCPRCRAFMSLDPTMNATCPCGGLHKDADAGRFGSSFGDGEIEIYRAAARQ